MRAVGWEFKKARNLFTEILRGPSYNDDASCLAFVAGFVSIFLWQVEPLLWRRGIFRVLETYEGKWPNELHPFSGFWLFPFEWVPPALRGSLWIPVVIVFLVNAVLLDRFVAKQGGEDVAFRSSILRLRRLLAGVPILGLCVIPLWRILCNRKPAWACLSKEPRLTFERPQGGPPSLPQPALDSFAFLVWLLLSNLFALRAAVAWLNEPERATATGLLVIQGTCGSLRIVGMAFTMAYVLLRVQQGALWGKRKWGLLISSGAWVLPQSLFLLPTVALLLVGERWGAVMEDVRAKPTQEREADRLIGDQVLLDLRTVTLDRATLGVLRLYREKTFLLMTEVASVMMLVVPLRERFPLMNLPGCAVSLLFIAALLSFPIGGILYARYLFQARSKPADWKKKQMEHPFARYLLLSSLAVIGGFGIGVTAGARELKTLALLLFWIGAYGMTIGFFIAFWGLLKARESSSIIWPMLFMCIGMTGYQMQQSSLQVNVLGLRRHIEDAAQFHLFKLYLMIPLVLVLTAFVGIYRCRWLLRPFRAMDIFNRMAPIGVRRRLAFLVVTACLPLGGVLVPVWIRMRAELEEQPLPT